MSVKVPLIMLLGNSLLLAYIGYRFGRERGIKQGLEWCVQNPDRILEEIRKIVDGRDQGG